ncbi:MAG: hypothetical protein IJI71_09035 [Clostridia bacterium]|nr:hypothetical protein [Clostridia bacterium]
MKTGKIILRSVAFLLVLALAIYAIPGQLFGINSAPNYMRAKGFYSESKGKLDAVFMGASSVHRFWLPAVGWQKSGIAVFNLSFSSLPITSFVYLLTEARKTQPDALYIINLNTFKYKHAADKIENFHTVLDYMPLTMEKIRFVHSISKTSGFSFDQQLELLFPFIRFHSRWNELHSWSYGTRAQTYKNTTATGDFTQKSVDYSDRFLLSDTRIEPREDTMQVFTDLLDYLDQEHVNALFVKVPQVFKEEYHGYLNVMTDLLKSRGYPCLDMMEEYQAYGLNLQRDFYDPSHTNIRGALKVTEYMTDYLLEHYHFADKRGQAEYADWDEESGKYDRLIDSWILPFEREANPWQALPAPKINEAKAEGSGIRLTWSASKGADGYVIYRKTAAENDGHWKLAATLGADALSYMDEALSANIRYTYCVAPFVDANGQKAYGNYNIKGASCTSPKELRQSSTQEKTGGDGN